MYIRENKPVYRYLLQLQDMGEDMGEYETLWAYTEGETERRFPFFEYPVPDFSVTSRYTNLDVGEDEVRTSGLTGKQPHFVRIFCSFVCGCLTCCKSVRKIL